ncbi:MAG: hypothetical protein KDD94_02565 [Calditrichaeota bacterium]|nr:hypothetical protein [Calditrichota bacterium]
MKKMLILTGFLLLFACKTASDIDPSIGDQKGNEDQLQFNAIYTDSLWDIYQLSGEIAEKGLYAWLSLQVDQDYFYIAYYSTYYKILKVNRADLGISEINYLLEYISNGDTIRNYGLSEILLAADGRLAVGNWSNSYLAFISDSSVDTLRIDQERLNNDIHCFKRLNPSQFLIGTHYGIIKLYDENSQTISDYTTVDYGSHIDEILLAAGQISWVDGEDGLYLNDNGSWTEVYPHSASALIQHDQQLHYSFADTVFVYENGNSSAFAVDSLTNGSLLYHGLLSNQNKAVFITDGFRFIIKESNYFRSLDLPISENTSYKYRSFIDSDGSYWFFNSTGLLVHYRGEF